MRINDTKTGYEIIEEKAKIVRLIFEMCSHVSGLWGIAKYLNENKVPILGRGKHWYKSTIQKIIRNRAAIGEYQTYHYVDGIRKPLEHVIKDYFPAIISDQDFSVAQLAIKNRKSDAGRKGSIYSNVLSGLVYCSCGSKMIYKNRGIPPKGGKYLICTSRHLKTGCLKPEWRLDYAEEQLFNHLLEINFDELTSKNYASEKSLQSYIVSLEANASDIQNKMSNLVNFLMDDLNEDAKKIIKDTLNELTEQIKSINKEIENKKNRI